MTEEYLKYIDSPAWKVMRREKAERSGWKCEVCGRGHKLSVHHKRYPKVLGTEKMSDLELLCIYCHAMRDRQKIYKDPSRYSEEFAFAVLPPTENYFELARKMSANGQYACKRCGKVHSPKFIC
jgi:hypothetical protein